MPKSKLENKTLVHGKSLPRTLEDVWGVKGSLYHTKNEDEYEQYVDELNKNELYSHAAKVGVKPTNAINRNMTKKKLMSAFRKYTNKYNPPAQTETRSEEKKREDARKVEELLKRK